MPVGRRDHRGGGVVHSGGWIGLGGTALALGIAGTVAGAGVGGVYLSDTGASVRAVVGLMALATGLWMLLWGAGTLTRRAYGWWRLLAVRAGLLVLAFILFPLTVAVIATNRPATPLDSTNPADHGSPTTTWPFG
jgi:hypothetical protein